MLMTPSEWNSSIFSTIAFLAIPAVLAVAFGANSYADIEYFKDAQIDYWKIAGAKPKSTDRSRSETKGGDVTTPGASLPFPWKKYSDPKNDEFFREGEYLPPAPFMEIARNPNDENIEHWFKYLEAKNEITRRLQAKLSEYAAKNAQVVSDNPDIQKSLRAVPESVAIMPNAKRYRLRLYFDSKCPHCERMMGTLRSLAQQGFLIELKQVDKDTQVRGRIPFPVIELLPNELKQYQIETVPTLLVGDLVSSSYFKIQGYQTEQSVLAAIFKFSSKKGGGTP